MLKGIFFLNCYYILILVFMMNRSYMLCPWKRCISL